MRAHRKGSFDATLREKEAGSHGNRSSGTVVGCLAGTSRCLRIAAGLRARAPVADGHIGFVAGKRKIIAVAVG